MGFCCWKEQSFTELTNSSWCLPSVLGQSLFDLPVNKNSNYAAAPASRLIGPDKLLEQYVVCQTVVYKVVC